MRSKMQVYGPDELKVLNQIVNAVLQETQSASGIAGVPKAQLRERIGKQVLKRAANDVLNINGIRRAVLASLKEHARNGADPAGQPASISLRGTHPTNRLQKS
jgi:hypothetical protein